MKSLVIARLTFHEAARRKVLLAAILLGLAFLTVFGLGYHYISLDLEKQFQFVIEPYSDFSEYHSQL